MELDNETLLGAYLAHLQSLARQLARLDFARAHHENAEGPRGLSTTRRELMETWEKLREQLLELVGLPLKSFGQLTEPGAFHTEPDVLFGNRLLRWNFGKLKKMADRHRRQHPEFTMLKSWDYEARKRISP